MLVFVLGIITKKILKERIMKTVKSRWKRTGNDTVSQISLEMLKREIIELVEIFKEQKKSHQLSQSSIEIVENELLLVSNLLIRISKQSESERKKYPSRSDDIDGWLKNIYYYLDLKY